MRPQQPDVPQIRINRRIRVEEVRVISAEGEQLGVMPTNKALAMAEEQGLDLVEISPKEWPPVCRILDFGKYKYLQSKKEKTAKANASQVVVKEAQLHYKTDDHDIATLVRKSAQWLSEGNRVKIAMRLRGRENAHAELGRKKIQGMLDALAEYGKPDGGIRQEGNTLMVVLARGK